MSANIATPSLSYDPATDLLMYDGTIPTKAALARPAPEPRICGTIRTLSLRPRLAGSIWGAHNQGPNERNTEQAGLKVCIGLALQQGLKRVRTLSVTFALPGISVRQQCLARVQEFYLVHKEVCSECTKG
jgi:hypothetical protein